LSGSGGGKDPQVGADGRIEAGVERLVDQRIRFAKARARLGFPGLPPLRSDAFRVPKIDSPQGDLF